MAAFRAAPRLSLLLGLLTASHGLRLRRELRSLSGSELDDLFDALRTMKRVGRAEGQRRFGADYQPYDHFVVKHAVAVLDERGDQGHFGPCFMTYHRAFLLEMEGALLSVLRSRNSSLDALPYWDPTLDSDTGRHFKDPELWIFSSNFLGGFAGDPDERHVVTDGRTSHWPLGRFHEDLVEEAYRKSVFPVYQGSPVTGLLRGPSNQLNTSHTTRLPKTGFPTLGGHDDIQYTDADQHLCTDARWVLDWMDWQDCIENARVRGRSTNESAWWNYASGLHWLHSQFHVKIGSYSGDWPLDFPFMDHSLPLTMGDLMDVATSPNDPIFLFQHANVDRINMAWQHAAVAAHPDLPERHWGFPETYGAWQTEAMTRDPELVADNLWRSAADGCQLHDVVNEKYPFPWIEGLPYQARGQTHADILKATAPGKAQYTYDDLLAQSVDFIV